MLKRAKGKCHHIARTEEEIHKIYLQVLQHRLEIAKTTSRLNLAFASEAIVLMVLETFHRKRRGIRVDDHLLVAATDNVMKEFCKEPWLPHRNQIRKLNERAKEIVANRTSPFQSCPPAPAPQAAV